MDERGTSAANERGRPLHPPDAATGTGERSHARASRLHLTLETGAIVQDGHVELGAAAHEMWDECGQRTLGATGHEAVDHIQDTQAFGYSSWGTDGGVSLGTARGADARTRLRSMVPTAS